MTENCLQESALRAPVLSISNSAQALVSRTMELALPAVDLDPRVAGVPVKYPLDRFDVADLVRDGILGIALVGARLDALAALLAQTELIGELRARLQRRLGDDRDQAVAGTVRGGEEKVAPAEGTESSGKGRMLVRKITQVSLPFVELFAVAILDQRA